MALRELMRDAGLGRTFQNMSIPTLRKSITKAKATGETMIKRSTSYAPVDLLETFLAQAEGTVISPPPAVIAPLAFLAPSMVDTEKMGENEELSPMLEDAVMIEKPKPAATDSQKPIEDYQAHTDSLEETMNGLANNVSQKSDSETTLTPLSPMPELVDDAPEELQPEKKKDNDTSNRSESAQVDDKGDSLNTSIEAVVQRAQAWRLAIMEERAQQTAGKKRKALEEEGEENKEEEEEMGALEMSSSDYDSEDEENEEGEAAMSREERTEKRAEERAAKRRKMEEEKKEKVKKYAEKKANESSTWLKVRALNRLNGTKPEMREPRNVILEAMQRNTANHTYRNLLGSLSMEPLTAEQTKKLQDAAQMGPNYLARTASLTPGTNFDTLTNGTNGFTTQMLMMPAADTSVKQGMHARISDIPQGVFIYMLGHHLMWTDLPQDQLLSQTIDPVFSVTHALCRHHTGQLGTTIQITDRRKAKDVNGDPAAFYPALELYDAVALRDAPIWNKPALIKLHPRKFTQEYLSHGTIRVEDTRFQQASVEKLIKDGLYDIFPAFEVPDDHERAGLYTSQVVFRKAGFPPGDVKKKRHPRIYSYKFCATSTPFTEQFLKLVRKVTLNFMNMTEKEDPDLVQPHLHVFLSFCTFQKRPRNDPALVEWLLKHYTAADVVDLYDDGKGGVQPAFTHVANNLPGVMQYLDLLRDACAAFDLPPLPANVVTTHNKHTGKYYADVDAENHRDHVASTPYDADEQRDRRDRNAKRRRTKAAEEKKRKAAGLSGLKRGTKSVGQSSDASDGSNAALQDGLTGIEIEDVAGETEGVSVNKAPASVDC